MLASGRGISRMFMAVTIGLIVDMALRVSFVAIRRRRAEDATMGGRTSGGVVGQKVSKGNKAAIETALILISINAVETGCGTVYGPDLAIRVAIVNAKMESPSFLGNSCVTL